MKRSEKNAIAKTQRGEMLVANDNYHQERDFDLSWFKPTTGQQQIVHSIMYNDLTVVQASSGCGKSTTAVFAALKLLKEGKFKHVVFIKTPAEYGTDQIGFLQGGQDMKLSAHFETMRSIFHDFMSPAKLEYEEKKKRIQFMVPNFIAGKTFYDSIVLIDEAQTIDPNTMKMLLERSSDSSIYVVLGDKYQRYASKKREDGLTDLISKITNDDGVCVEENMNVIRLGSQYNMRSALSKRITELYEGV